MASQNPSSLHARRARAAEHETEFTEKAGETLKATLDEIKGRSDDAKAVVKEYVNQKPFKALGIAVLSGMALALLMRR